MSIDIEQERFEASRPNAEALRKDGIFAKDHRGIYLNRTMRRQFAIWLAAKRDSAQQEK